MTPAELADLRARFTAALYTDIARRRRRRRVRVEMVTFIDRDKVRPTLVRGVPTWGYTYKLAGFVDDGETEGGLLALRCPPEHMPAPAMPIGATGRLWSAA